MAVTFELILKASMCTADTRTTEIQIAALILASSFAVHARVKKSIPNRDPIHVANGNISQPEAWYNKQSASRCTGIA